MGYFYFAEKNSALTGLNGPGILAPRQNMCLHNTHQVLWYGSLLGGSIQLPGPLALWWNRFSLPPFLEHVQERCSNKKREPLVLGLCEESDSNPFCKNHTQDLCEERVD